MGQPPSPTERKPVRGRCPGLPFSVRSAFDLLLAALALPPGDEVLMTAVTHPDMARIVEAHGLVVVTVDLDPATLAPGPEELEQAAARPRVRALVVAHLFGTRCDLGPYADIAARRGLLLVEDCAQALAGPRDHGDTRADVSLFSFGPIKTATALGGALAWVRRPALAAAMAAQHDRWPVQRRRQYAARAVKALVAMALSGRRAYGLAAALASGLGTDVGELVRGAPRAGEPAFTGWLRRRPCAGLVETMARRTGPGFPTERLARRAAAGDALAAALGGGARPGSALASTHWLFPVTARDPAALIADLRSCGLDASAGATQIRALGPAPRMQAAMAATVFVPAYPELGPDAMGRLAAVVRRHARDGGQPVGETAAMSPAEDRPLDHSPVHTADLPATPQRDRAIPATAWVEAPPEVVGLGADLGHPTALYIRRIGDWLVWRAGPAAHGDARYMALDSADLSRRCTYRLHPDGRGEGTGADGHVHQRFRAWKESLRDAPS